jgi:hypothetical protein
MDHLLAAIAALDPGVAGAARGELAQLWLADALDEHASIAAFARFSLELLALGAPPDLLARTHQAALDEVDHARLAFALAGRFGGEPVGPAAMGPLAVATGDVRAIVAATVRDGCLGETAAAAVAARERDACELPAVRAVLARIADDERRHAELAWRFVAWAIVQSPSLGEVVGAELACRTHGGHDEPEPAPTPLVHFGRLGSAGRARVAASIQERVRERAVELLADPGRVLAELVHAGTVVGRPFEIAGVRVRAAAVRRGDWG